MPATPTKVASVQHLGLFPVQNPDGLFQAADGVLAITE
jgi:hypothetical protein